MSEHHYITDLFGNKIKVENPSEAINQARFNCSSSYTTQPFELDKDGLSNVIKGRENERIPWAAYYEDMLYKLKLNQLDVLPKGVNIFFSQEAEGIHCWETTSARLNDVPLLCEAVCSTGLVQEDIPVDFLVCEINNPDNVLIQGRLFTSVY